MHFWSDVSIQETQLCWCLKKISHNVSMRECIFSPEEQVGMLDREGEEEREEERGRERGRDGEKKREGDLMQPENTWSLPSSVPSLCLPLVSLYLPCCLLSPLCRPIGILPLCLFWVDTLFFNTLFCVSVNCVFKVKVLHVSNRVELEDTMRTEQITE